MDGNRQPLVGVCEAKHADRRRYHDLTVESNVSAARSTTFRIAGRDFVVQQASAPCSYLAGAPTREVPYTQSTREIGVITQSHCSITATENASWIQIVSAPTIGSGEIVIRVDENTSAMSARPLSRSSAKILSIGDRDPRGEKKIAGASRDATSGQQLGLVEIYQPSGVSIQSAGNLSNSAACSRAERRSAAATAAAVGGCAIPTTPNRPTPAVDSCGRRSPSVRRTGPVSIVRRVLLPGETIEDLDRFTSRIGLSRVVASHAAPEAVPGADLRVGTTETAAARRLVPPYSNRVPTAVAQPPPITSSLRSRTSMTERIANVSPPLSRSRSPLILDPSKTPLVS